MSKYFTVVSCSKGFLSKYTLISFTSFGFLLDINITMDFSTLKLILLLFDHSLILLNSMLENVYTSLTISPLIAIIRSLANGRAFVRLTNLSLSKDLYWMFQNPGPHQDTCRHPLLIPLSILSLFVDKIAVRWLKWLLIKLHRFLGQQLAFKLFKILGQQGALKAPCTCRLTNTIISPAARPSSSCCIYGGHLRRETILVGIHEIMGVNVMINSIYQDLFQYFSSCVVERYWAKFRIVFSVFFSRFCNW